jgi:hypothetical protein
MKYRNIFSAAVLMVIFVATGGHAQANSDAPVFRPTVLTLEVKKSDLKTEFVAPIRSKANNEAKVLSAGRFHKRQFLLLSAAVYGASLADMRQTLKERKYSWWYETDPLARPFVKLPAPAYYAAGLAMATGLNWISWKMGHSRKWHKLAAVPQLIAIGGNTYGFQTNRFN